MHNLKYISLKIVFAERANLSKRTPKSHYGIAYLTQTARHIDHFSSFHTLLNGIFHLSDVYTKKSSLDPLYTILEMLERYLHSFLRSISFE